MTNQITNEVVSEEKLNANIPVRTISPNFIVPNEAISPTNAYILIPNNNGVSFEKTVAGDNYFYFLVTLTDSQIGKDIYVSFDIVGDRKSQAQWEFYYVSTGGTLRQPRFLRFGPDALNFRRYKFKIPAVKREEFDGNTNFWLTLWTHGTAGQTGEIRNLIVSDVPYEADLSDAIIKKDFLESKGELIGDYPVPRMNRVYSSNVPTNMLAFTNSTSVKQDGMVLTKVAIYSSVRNVAYTASIANLDQRNLMVNEVDITSYLGNLEVGVNVFDLTKYNLPIENGQYLIIKSSELALFTNPNLRVPSLIQDTDHSISEEGYEGYNFYETQLQSPLYYEVAEKSRIQAIETEVETSKKRIEEVATDDKQPILTAPNGTRYRLEVADNGDLITVSTVPTSVVMMGNSITSEKGGIGMAASDQYHDWYYLVQQHILGMNPSASFVDRKNITVWESAGMQAGNTISEKRQEWWNRIGMALVPENADLVILQLGDNVNTPAREETLEADVATLIQNVKTKAPRARVLFVACWYGDETKVGKIRRGCESGGGEFVDITDTSGDKRSHIGATRTGIDGTTWTVTSAGEASHPGNNGMKYIADQVINIIGI